MNCAKFLAIWPQMYALLNKALLAGVLCFFIVVGSYFKGRSDGNNICLAKAIHNEKITSHKQNNIPRPNSRDLIERLQRGTF